MNETSFGLAIPRTSTDSIWIIQIQAGTVALFNLKQPKNL